MELSQIHPLLAQIHGCTFASMDTITVPDLRGGQSNPMKDKVLKVCKNQRIILFANKRSNGYENMVKRRRAAEGKDPELFELQPPKWGERIPNTPLYRHEKGGRVYFYLQTIFLRPGEPKFYFEGKEIKREDVQGLVEAPEAGNQGLSRERQVVVRTFRLDNITEIRMMGTKVHDATDAEIEILNVVCPELA